MASRIKKGKYGMTVPRADNVLGTVVVSNQTFNNIKGEIIAYRDDYYKYYTVQVPSEYQGRVYVLNLLDSQCKNIQWRS